LLERLLEVAWLQLFMAKTKMMVWLPPDHHLAVRVRDPRSHLAILPDAERAYPIFEMGYP
jgi:hypothetical protein